MHNAQTLQLLFNHFNESKEDEGEEKECVALLLENLLRFYAARHPVITKCVVTGATQLSLLQDGEIEEEIMPLVIEDEWLITSQACRKYTFVNHTTLSKYKKKMRDVYPKFFNKCFLYTEINGLLGLHVNIQQLCRFILKHKRFAPRYHDRIKDLIKGKTICLS